GPVEEAGEGAAGEGGEGKRPKGELARGPRRGHRRGPARIAGGPDRIVGRAGPAHRPAVGEGRQERDDQHADRLATDVGQRREGDLAAQIGRRIAAAQRGQRVRGLVDGRREEKHSEPQKALEQWLRVHSDARIASTAPTAPMLAEAFAFEPTLLAKLKDVLYK